MTKNKVPVKGYNRTRLGKVEIVRNHDRRSRRSGKKYNKIKKSDVNRPGKQLIQENTLFKEAKYKKYNKIVSFRSISEAEESVSILESEFKDAKTKSKKLRVARVTQFSANKVRVMARKKDLKTETRNRYKKISRMYGKSAIQMWKEYRRMK